MALRFLRSKFHEEKRMKVKKYCFVRKERVTQELGRASVETTVHDWRGEKIHRLFNTRMREIGKAGLKEITRGG